MVCSAWGLPVVENDQMWTAKRLVAIDPHISLFAIHDRGDQSRRSNAVTEEILWSGCSDNRAIMVFGCIDMDMVLVYNESFRDDMEALINSYWKLLISIGKLQGQFFFWQYMLKDAGRETFVLLCGSAEEKKPCDWHKLIHAVFSFDNSCEGINPKAQIRTTRRQCRCQQNSWGQRL